MSTFANAFNKNCEMESMKKVLIDAHTHTVASGHAYVWHTIADGLRD